MAAGGKPVQSQFEKQDQETLVAITSLASKSVIYRGAHSNLSTMLDRLRMEGESGFCDVVLEVEGQHLSVHRCVLAANSQFFYTMFSSGMKESTQRNLKLYAVSATAMSSILTYFYTREITIGGDNVLELLNCASFLLVSPVKKACLRYLSDKLSIENCFATKHLAEKYDAVVLLQKTKDFISKNFFRLIKMNGTEDFLSVSQLELMEWIRCNDISIAKEEDMYFAVLDWVRYDLEQRKSLLPELLENLRIKSLPKAFLQNQLKTEPLLRDSASCQQLVKKFTKRRQKRRRQTSKVITEARPSTQISTMMVGVDAGGGDKAFLYDINSKEILVLPRLPSSQVNASVAVIDNTIFLVGGDNYFHAVNDLKCYTLGGKQLWERRSSFHQARKGAALAVLSKHIYVIGGFRGSPSACLQSVECYDSESNSWSVVGALQFPRGYAGAAASKDHIFVVGGADNDSLHSRKLNSVEMYNPSSNTWKVVAPMKEARSYPQTAFLRGKVYAICGIDTTNLTTCTCEVYSPSTDEWSFISPRPYPSCGIGNLVVLRNQIHVRLGQNSQTDNAEAVRFIASKNSWMKVESFGPTNQIGPYKILSLKLPRMYQQNLVKVGPSFFDDCLSSDEEDDIFYDHGWDTDRWDSDDSEDEDDGLFWF